MRMRDAAFTLIELLIVIAIIGILAAVLVPNLLGARASAIRRAAQAHSANVYKALNAALADDASLDAAEVLAAYGSDCTSAKEPGSTAKYGWSAAPSNTASCGMELAATGDNFKVTIVTTENGGSSTYINGELGP